MRSTLVSALLGLSLLTGCEVGDPGSNGEAPDAGASEVDAPAAVPRLAVTVDKPTVMTELGTSTMITVTLTGSGGFAGPVTLTATVVDGAGAAVPGWTVGLNQATVNVAADGMAVAVATLQIPTLNSALAGTVTIDAVSTAGTQSTTSAVTALNQVSVTVTENAGQCVYPSAEPMQVVAGTKVRFVNKFTTDNITIHVDGNANNVPHESDPGHAPNTAYEREVMGTTGTITWYCHAPGPNLGGANPRFQVVAAP